MFLRLHYIWIILFMFLFSTGAYAQVHIGDGVTISNGTIVTIQNQDVIIATDEIKGEGVLFIQNDKIQKITVLNNFRTNSTVQIISNEIRVEGRYAQKFAAHHLPPLSEEIIASSKKEQLKKDLPIRYINTEGLVYDKDEDKKADPVLTSLPKDVSGGIIVSEILQMQVADIQSDYIIPIYSVILNDERILGSAELYEFECLTALLRPPIV